MDPSTLRASADRALGERLERQLSRHHVRRLRRLGWERILQTDSPGWWATGDPPPRSGNLVEVLVDGATAFSEMERAMLDARSHIHLADWALSPDFRLSRPDAAASLLLGGQEGRPLRELLAELAERVSVRLLLWAGPPVPWAPLGRWQIEALRDELTRGTKVECLLDAHERPLHTHHEKMLVVDDQVAFVGGLDPTFLRGDRYDSSEHPLRQGPGWHDMAARLKGPAVADVAAHFNLRWTAVSGRAVPPISPAPEAGPSPVQVVATIPEAIYSSVPRGRFRILDAYRRALLSAKELIYLENQFLWSPEISEILRQKLLDPPSERFRMLIILPAKADIGTDDTRGQLGSLLEADRDRRLLACTLYSRSSDRSGLIYVHAKVAIVDDHWLTVGSANLNDHSLFNDTELNLAILDRELAIGTRHRLWAEHLELPLDRVSGPAAEMIDRVWRPTAEEQYERRRAGKALTARVARLPGTSRRSDLLLGPMQNLVLDG